MSTTHEGFKVIEKYAYNLGRTQSRLSMCAMALNRIKEEIEEDGKFDRISFLISEIKEITAFLEQVEQETKNIEV